MNAAKEIEKKPVTKDEKSVPVDNGQPKPLCESSAIDPKTQTTAQTPDAPIERDDTAKPVAEEQPNGTSEGATTVHREKADATEKEKETKGEKQTAQDVTRGGGEQDKEAEREHTPVSEKVAENSEKVEEKAASAEIRDEGTDQATEKATAKQPIKPTQSTTDAETRRLNGPAPRVGAKRGYESLEETPGEAAAPRKEETEPQKEVKTRMVGQAKSTPAKPTTAEQPSREEAPKDKEKEKNGAEAPKKKRERRHKDENSQRNYICGCRKRYLSYAALYTHAKTKHNGIFPEGTTTLHKKRQGRPKKDEWCALKINAEYQKTSDFNKDFLHYLDMIPGAKAETEGQQTDLVDFFPKELFREARAYQAILAKVEQIRKDLIDNYGTNFLSQIDIIIYEINNAKSLNCNEIFSLFLIYVFRFVTREFYRELVFFVLAYKAMMNQKGWEKCKETGNGFGLDPSKEFCEEQNAEFVPDFANYFILDFFADCFGPRRLLKEGVRELKFFGTESIKLLRVILLIKHFCLWLYNNKFTKAKIDIFKE